MKARWVSLVVLGGLCALARAEIKLVEYSGYVEGVDRDYYVVWLDVDPNDPNNPLQPQITIFQDIDGVPYHFRCWDDVTDDPADIYSIGGDSELSEIVQVLVAGADGYSVGAQNVGLLDFDGAMEGWFPSFHISGTLGTLGQESNIAAITGSFWVADLGARLHVKVAIESGVLYLTSGAAHHEDIEVKALWNNAEIVFLGDYLGTLTLGSAT